MRTLEEIEREGNLLIEEDKRLLELPDEEFLKPENRYKMISIHKKMLMLALELLGEED